jgi:hypothetical protein
MNNFRDKLQIFVIGLLMGILLGGGFFLLKLDEYLSNFQANKADKGTISEEEVSEQKISEKVPRPSKEKNQENQSRKSSPGNDSISALQSRVHNRNESLLDSLSADSLDLLDDEIIVRKDELLNSRSVELIFIGSTKKNKDSLLQKLTGIKEGQDNPIYKVEFWRSPLNYRGYKMSRNKLVLFGIGSSEPIILYKLEDRFYLKHLQNSYRLDFTDGFRPFDRVTDEEVLAKLQ